MFNKMPTSALLERVAKHIDRLDRVLKDSEDLLTAIKCGDRADWIQELQGRLDAAAKAEAPDEPAPPAPPFYRS